MNVIDPPVSVNTRGLQALIEEARHHRNRRRRRWASTLVVVAVVVGASVVFTRGGGPQKAPNPSHAPRAAPFLAHWTRPRSSATGLPPGTEITDVARIEGRLVAAGSFLPPNTGSRQSPSPPGAKALSPVVWTSVDGSTWSEAWDPSGIVLGTDTFQELVATPTAILLFDPGDDETALWRSTNGTSFEPVSLPPAMRALRVISVTWGHGLVVAALSNKYVGGPDTPYGESDTVWISPDGLTWQQATLGGTAVLKSITTTATGFLVGGETGSTKLPTLWTSSDGSHWNSTTLSEKPGSVTSVASAATTMIAAGAVGGANASWWSKNGSKWAPASLPGVALQPFPFQPFPTVIATTAGFVASGFGAGGGMSLWASSSGAVWSAVTNESEPSSSTSSLDGVYPDQGGALAVVQARSSLRVNVWKVSFSKTSPTRLPTG